jgi:hypothetical protein
MSASRLKPRPELSRVELRFASADRVLGRALLAIATGCVGVAALEFALLASRSPAPLDAAVLPLVIGVAPACAGGLLLLAELAMRQQTGARWMVQCGALLAPMVLGLFVWLAW